MIRSYKGVRPTVPASCYVDPSAQVIGDVVLGEQASIWMNAVVRGDVNAIRIGARSNVQDCAVLHGMRDLYPVHVGEMVTIGHNPERCADRRRFDHRCRRGYTGAHGHSAGNTG